MSNEEWFTLDSIEEVESDEKLYCIAVDNPDKQFLIGNINVPTHNTDEGKAEDELRGEASMIIGSIARLGRAAGVHLILATQRPDAKLIPGETKENLHVRINCGQTRSTASSMILDNSEGTRVKAAPRGRMYIQIHGKGDHGQGFFADPDWIDNWLDSKGLDLDGTPKSGKTSRLAKLTDMSEFEDSTLDEREGIDNQAEIERIRTEDEGQIDDTIISGDDDSSESDDEWVFDESDSEIDPEALLEDFDDDEENESSEPEESETPKSENVGGMERPELKGNENSVDKYKRPEDDWDSDLENLIDENNS